jgi:2-iminoacetate synthase ThiH
MESIVQSTEIDNNKREEPNKLLPSHYYMEGDRVIFTEEFHIKRGTCCGNYCRHCAYEPKHTKGTISLRKN